MSQVLRVTLLGDFGVTWDGRELSALQGSRRRELLAFLLLRRDAPQTREHLAFLLWPDSTESQARTNLRQLLYHLRRELPHWDRFLEVDTGTLQWRPKAPAVIDLHELEEAWTAAGRAAEREDRQGELMALDRAASLYRGDLLPGSYRSWLEPKREELRRRSAEGLRRLTELLEEERRYGPALDAAERLRVLDPLRESTHRTLIRLHALNGEPAKGVAVFRDLSTLLEEELGVAPEEGTQALVQRIREGKVSFRRPPPPAHSPPSTPTLVGRHRPWRQLMEAWEQASGGRAGLVLVTGEAGIGKTRLAEEFLEALIRQGNTAARARAHAGEGALPYDPVAQWLRSPPFPQAARSLSPVWRADLARIVPELADEGPEEGEGWSAAEGGWRRARLFEALARAVLAPGAPTVLLLDDIQWADRETLEWLSYLLRYDPDAPLLVLATLRLGELPVAEHLPRWRESLRGSDRLLEIPLGPLDPKEAWELAEAMGNRTLKEDEAATLHRETEGNPLFLVETLRAGAGSALSSRIQGVIRYRIEQLTPNAREIMGLAATVGRGFRLEVLREAASFGFGEGEVIRALDELSARHLIQERDGSSLEFTHDRIREVAADELSSARRRFFHRRVAEALEGMRGTRGEPASSAVARHFERAGLPERALPHYRRAADQALSVYAHEEAAGHLERALQLLVREPPSRDRTRRELELHIALGVPLVAMHHYSGDRVWAVYTRAQALAEELGDPPDPPVLRALALASLMRSRIDDALTLGKGLLSAAEEHQDPVLPVEANYVLGVTYYWRGRIRAARQHLEKSLHHYEPSRAREHLRLYAQDPAIICRTRLALTLWHLGDEARARRMVLKALDDARRLEQPSTLAYARYFGSWVLIECGDLAEARSAVHALVRDSSARALSVWPEMAAILEGWLMVAGGANREGLQRLKGAIREYQGWGVSLGLPYHLSLLARAARRVGAAEEALAHLEKGSSHAGETGQRFWDAELQRLRGQVLQAVGGSEEEISTAFESAVEIAREQGARALERRASTSLAQWEEIRGTTGRTLRER